MHWAHGLHPHFALGPGRLVIDWPGKVGCHRLRQAPEHSGARSTADLKACHQVMHMVCTGSCEAQEAACDVLWPRQ